MFLLSLLLGFVDNESVLNLQRFRHKELQFYSAKFSVGLKSLLKLRSN